MIALLTIKSFEDNQTITDYVAMSDCENYQAAAEYAERIFGDTIEELKIEILDTELYLNEEIFNGIREDKYLMEDGRV